MNMINAKRQRRPNIFLSQRFILYFILSLLIIYALAPLVWIALTSVKTREDLYRSPLNYIPHPLTLENFVIVWNSSMTPFKTFFINSIIVVCLTTIVTIIVSILAGYALARFNFVKKDEILVIFLSTQMLPAVLLVPPLLRQWSVLGILNTRLVLILSNFSFTIPFSTWMLTGFFTSIPIEIEQSAMVDGCTRFGALVRVVLPLSAPGIVACGIYTFISAWSELIFAILFINSMSKRTLPAGLMYMMGQYEVLWGQLSAGLVISVLPLVILFAYVQQYLISGLTAGALKG